MGGRQTPRDDDALTVAESPEALRGVAEQLADEPETRLLPPPSRPPPSQPPPSQPPPSQPPPRPSSRPPGRPDALPPSQVGPTGPTRRLDTGASITVAQALVSEEAARCRSFGLVIALLAGGSAAVMPFLGGTPWLAGVTQAGLVWLFAVAVWVWRVGAREERYSAAVFRLFGWSCVLVSVFIDYHLGVFSPAPMAVTLGISFFALSDDRRLALTLSGAATAGYMALVLGVLSGVLPDAGLSRAAAVPPSERLYLALVVPAVLVVTLLQARESRAATHEALRQAQRAMLLANQQEARLQEANLDLDAALRAAAGQQGRYSGSRAGAYLLSEVIGRGAMGEVYRASDAQGNPAAVKMLLASAARDEGLLRRFLREGDLAARLRSPHVVRVFEVGEAPDGSPFLAMELLRGVDLSALLRQRGRLPLDEAVALVQQVAEGLAAAHAAGIVHRDLKPQNLFRAEGPDGQPRWKIVDFGVSKLRSSRGTLTQRAVIGTPGYMAPEQAQGLDAEPRSDLFSLGAVAYRALTGRPPFSGPDTPQILFSVCYRSPQRPSSLVESLPPDVDDALAIALAKSPDDRFESPAALAEALAAAAEGRLPEHLRTRAAVLVDALPWGQRLLRK